MSYIRPFAAIRYSTAASRDLSARIAPPYDVLDAAGKRALLARDPRNFIEIDLPQVPAKDAGPPEIYAAARRTMDAWIQDKTFVRDDKEAVYVYHQQYRHAGVSYTRRMFFARMRLEQFGAGNVFPHERTFGGPKEDRLALMKATQANLSPIFGLYEDPSNAVAETLQSAITPEPLASGTLDGVENRLWAVNNPARIDEVVRLMQPKPIYIADGHHRYGTALLYRDWVAEQLSSRGALPADHPANFTLFVFCAMEDAGLLILPTHRVLPSLAVPVDALRRDTQLRVERLNAPDADAAVAALSAHGPQAIGFHSSAEPGYFVIRPVSASLLDALEPEHSVAWRRLALAILHSYLLDRLVVPQINAGRPPEIHYVKSAAEAVGEARDTRGSVFLMQPTTMAELRAVCQANDLMPQKSTFFYPKLASGLVINPLA